MLGKVYYIFRKDCCPMKKYVPNTLSLFRIIFSCSLLFFTSQKIPFTILYCLIALTDFLDGRLARKFNAQSKLGAKLDGLGDLSIFIVGFVCLMFLLKLDFSPNLEICLITLGIGLAFKALSFILTRVRFKEWNMMHTYMNKFLGAMLYFAVPIFLWMGTINYWVVLAYTLFSCATVAEDIVILLTSDHYDANHPGVLVKWWREQHNQADPPTAV